MPVDLNGPARNPLDGSLRPLTYVDLAKQQVLDESIALNRAAADIAGRGVKFSLLIVDACRDNPFVDLLKRAHASSPLKNATAPPATGLLAAASGAVAHASGPARCDSRLLPVPAHGGGACGQSLDGQPSQ